MFSFLKKKQFRSYRLQFESLKSSIAYLYSELENLEDSIKNDIELLEEVKEYKNKIKL